jgi:hypothetical protein
MGSRHIEAFAIACVLSLVAWDGMAESLSDTLRGALGSFSGPISTISRNSINTNLGAPASANGLTFEFDVETGLPKRIRGPLGPIFTERADTVGRGKLTLDVAYVGFKFDEIDGRDISNGELTFPVRSPLGTANAQIFANVRSDNLFIVATYGVSDNLDLSFNVPLTHNAVDLQVVTPLGSNRSITEVANESSGLNDISLYGKYRVLKSGPVAMAASLRISAPTGDADNFRGLGTWRAQPFLLASFMGHNIDAHINIGFDLGDTSKLNNELRYRLGVAWAMTERVTLAGDLLGRYILGGYNRLTVTGSEEASRFTPDAAFGVKLNFWKDALVFASALVALNDNGLRAHVAPAVGIEATF